MSPSMDILISSNLERLLFDLSGENDAEVQIKHQYAKDHGGVYAKTEGLLNQCFDFLFHVFWGKESRRHSRQGARWKGKEG